MAQVTVKVGSRSLTLNETSDLARLATSPIGSSGGIKTVRLRRQGSSGLITDRPSKAAISASTRSAITKWSRRA